MGLAIYSNAGLERLQKFYESQPRTKVRLNNVDPFRFAKLEKKASNVKLSSLV